MIAKAHSATLVGIDAVPVVVEVDLQGGIQDGDRYFILVGLPDKAVNGSKERVRTAIKNSSLDFPNRKIMCNLARQKMLKVKGARAYVKADTQRSS
jgi:magnesium chelatase family protein